jgi:cell division protein FtsN
MGLGKHNNADKGENGVWIGPFNEIVQAEDFARQKLSDKKVEKCKVCLK